MSICCEAIIKLQTSIYAIHDNNNNNNNSLVIISILSTTRLKQMSNASEEHLVWIIKEINRSEYYKCSMGRTYSLSNEIEAPCFEIWKTERLWPTLMVLAKQSLNKEAFLAPFPEEIRKWDLLVSARAVAAPGEQPPPNESNTNPIWSTIFSFINANIAHTRKARMSETDDNVFTYMCRSYVQGVTNPCFTPLMTDILCHAFDQESHATNAERIVSITNKMGRDWGLRIQAHAMDLILILTGMCLQSQRVAIMRDRVVAYLYEIHSNCD